MALLIRLSHILVSSCLAHIVSRLYVYLSHIWCPGSMSIFRTYGVQAVCLSFACRPLSQVGILDNFRHWPFCGPPVVHFSFVGPLPHHGISSVVTWPRFVHPSIHMQYSLSLIYVKKAVYLRVLTHMYEYVCVCESLCANYKFIICRNNREIVNFLGKRAWIGWWINKFDRNVQSTSEWDTKLKARHLSLTNSATCRCAPKLSPEHTLQDCPDLASKVRMFGQVESPIRTSSWGTSKVLKCTIWFMNHARIDA